MKSYPNSGALWPNENPKENSPNMSGTIKISADLIKGCPRDENGLITIRLAAWKKQGPKGSFLSVSASAPMAQKKEEWE